MSQSIGDTLGRVAPARGAAFRWAFHFGACLSNIELIIDVGQSFRFSLPISIQSSRVLGSHGTSLPSLTLGRSPLGTRVLPSLPPHPSVFSQISNTTHPYLASRTRTQPPAPAYILPPDTSIAYCLDILPIQPSTLVKQNSRPGNIIPPMTWSPLASIKWSHPPTHSHSQSSRSPHTLYLHSQSQHFRIYLMHLGVIRQPTTHPRCLLGLEIPPTCSLSHFYFHSWFSLLGLRTCVLSSCATRLFFVSRRRTGCRLLSITACDLACLEYTLPDGHYGTFVLQPRTCSARKIAEGSVNILLPIQPCLASWFSERGFVS